MTIKQALNLLLQGTELGYKLAGERTLTVVQGGITLPASQSQPLESDRAGRSGMSTDHRGQSSLNSYESSRRIWLAQAETSSAKASARSAAQSAEGQTSIISEIVVTASKREELLRDVPVAITAVTGEEIETQGIQSFRDYATLVPGLNQRDDGSPGRGTIILRGLNTGPEQSTNTAAFYLDDAPFSSSGFVGLGGLIKPEPELADIERIEVLKGPQGTLYGASSLGGLVRIVSKKPDSTQFSGNARAEGSNVENGETGYSVRASLDGPLVRDRLAGRVTGFYRRYPGFVDNVGTGSTQVNGGETEGARGALRWTPSDAFSLDVVGVYQTIDTEGGAFQDNVADTTTPVYGERKYSQFLDAPNSVEYRLLSGTADYDLGVGSIVTTASYAEVRGDSKGDITPVYGPFINPPTGVGLISDGGPGFEKFSAETRFVSQRLGSIEFVAGLFYTNEKNTYPIDYLGITADGQPVPGLVLVDSVTHSDYEETAGFGNLTFYLTDDLDITGGMRYAQNNQDLALTYSGLLLGPEVTDFYDSEESATTYLATLRWRPSDTISTFLRAASGYRPGGPQTQVVLPPGAQAVIRSDTVWNYEAGIKGDFLERKLEIAASVYHIDWSDVQLNTSVGGFLIQGNGGSAEVDGFEIELAVRPSTNLRMGANVGYTDARISSIDPAASAVLGAVKGNALPGTPDWTAAAVIDQTIPLSATVDAMLGGTLRYEAQRPTSYPASALNVNIDLPSITTVDLRAGIRFNNYTLQLRAENLLDKNGLTASQTSRLFPGQVVPSVATIIRPRTVTLSVSTQF